MTYEQASEAEFRQRLLGSPGERQGVDYKSGVAFGSDDEFTLKLLRHCQGMANAGGGWLVIGFREDTNAGLQVDPNHSDAIATTYEPTQVSNAANLYVERGQQLRVTVFQEVHPDTGVRHPVLRIEGLGRTPFVCRSTKNASGTNDLVFEQGAVYLRRPNASTSKVSTLQDWEEVIGRCIQNRREELLVELRELLERMESGTRPPAPERREQLEAWMVESRERATNGN